MASGRPTAVTSNRRVLGGQRLTWRGSELEIGLADQDEQVVLGLEVPDDQGRIGVGGGGDVPDCDAFVSARREQLPGGRQDAPPGVLAAGPAAVNVLCTVHILAIAAAPVTAGR